MRIGLLVLAFLAGGCINRPGMNVACHWPEEPSRPLDLRRHDDVHHLRHDIEVADELVVRYRDEEGGRRPRSILGIQVRTRSLGGRPRNADAVAGRTQLTETIERVHGLRDDQIVSITSQLADRGWDLPVTLPVLIVYLVLARTGVRWLRREFNDGSMVARTTATLLVSVAVAVVVVLIGGLWSGVSEIIRVGNEHLSFRASRIPWLARVPLWFVMTTVGFWAMVAQAGWTAKRSG